jgi:hypothetical protein
MTDRGHGKADAGGEFFLVEPDGMTAGGERGRQVVGGVGGGLPAVAGARDAGPGVAAGAWNQGALFDQRADGMPDTLRMEGVEDQTSRFTDRLK